MQTSGGDSHQAINILLDKAEDFLFKPVATHSVLSVGDAVAGPSSMCVNDVEAAVPCSLQNLLTHHITKMLDTSSVCELELCRERLWRQSLSFYKNSLHKPFRLTQEFKTALLQGLIFDEVIAKRQDHIAAFQKGLERLEVMELIRKHPQQMRKLFVHSDETLNADQFLSLIETPQTTPVTHQTWVWCKEYIVERSKEKTGEVIVTR